MAQKKIPRAEVYAHAVRASRNVKIAEVWVGARCAFRVRGVRGRGVGRSGRHSYGV